MATKNRSGAYCAWHSFWCVIATLILIGCIACNLAVRSYVKADNLAKKVGELNIATLTIDDQTVAEHIHEEYVSDAAVLPADVEAAVSGMGIEAFAADKLTALGTLLRGDSDEIVHITTDEIIELLERSEYDLYKTCMLIIEDSDKQELRNTLEKPLDVFNKTMTFLFGSPAMRMVSRWSISNLRLAVDVILLILVLWRWMVVRRNADRTRSGACKGMGLTILIPSALTLLATAVYSISGAFAPDGAQTLHTIGNVIAKPFWGISVLGIVSGVLLMLAAAVICRVAAQQRDAALAKTKPVAPVNMESVENVAKPDPFVAPMPQTSVNPAPASAPATTPCIACARALAEGSRFCIYCGTPQTPPAAPDAPAPVTEPAPAVTEPAPAVTEAAPAVTESPEAITEAPAVTREDSSNPVVG